MDHMQFRVRGRVKVTILVAFALAIANLRAADRWNDERARVTQLNAAIAAAKKSRSRRRAATIETHLGSSRRRRGRPAPAGAP
ncbi:hypothetical protein [Nocardioides sp.]|uniref:hypothetical protein n=1 Tax=Nocardioides sp. TaxID=35761 RepID=UPI0026171B14|nr:hypothetical protein [Nocardioides sp.]